MTMMALAPLSRSAIGFDRLFDTLATAQFEHTENYPPYNVEKTGENAYRITLAVAGFALEDLEITCQPNQLIVTGRRAQIGNGQYLHQGIAGRAFQRRFSLADYVKVSSARLNNGLLLIDFVREVPEAMKPRRIEIANSNPPPQQIEGKIAA